MRDFRDAKVMARTLRAALAAKGHKITISQSLELIAEAFGAADWNALSAAIRREASASIKGASSTPPIAEGARGLGFSRTLEATLHRALAHAKQRKHEYATLEHLLLALIDDPDASAVMKACKADLGALKANLTAYIDDELKGLIVDDERDAMPTAAFQRVTQRAVIATQESGRHHVTGAQFLLAIFAERESFAVLCLAEQGMTRGEAARLIASGDAAD